MKLTHSKLCEIAVKWLRKVKKQNCLYQTYPITGSEIACYNGVKWIETPDAIGFNAYSSCVIECKMSRSDYFADQKKPFRTNGNGMGQKRFYLCPENLIKESDLPQGWGLLYVDEKMKVKEVKNSDTFDLNVDGLKAERLALVSIAKGLKKHKGGRQMSELKAYTFSNMEGRGLAEYYLKSEADKVIAELKKERGWLAKDRAQAYDDLEKRAQLNIKQEESIRHNKYKRCLAMAKLAVKDDYAPWNMKWHKRWLELAEKFKEAK